MKVCLATCFLVQLLRSLNSELFSREIRAFACRSRPELKTDHTLRARNTAYLPLPAFPQTVEPCCSDSTRTVPQIGCQTGSFRAGTPKQLHNSDDAYSLVRAHARRHLFDRDYPPLHGRRMRANDDIDAIDAVLGRRKCMV
jgi:hypothetical protein